MSMMIMVLHIVCVNAVVGMSEMSGKDEGGEQKRKVPVEDIDERMIKLREKEPKEIANRIEKLFVVAIRRGLDPRCGFTIGELRFVRSKHEHRTKIITIRQRLGRFNNPKVFEYTNKVKNVYGRVTKVFKILWYRDGNWLDELFRVEVINQRLLTKYNEVVAEEKRREKYKKKRQRMRELGIDLDER